MTTFHKKLPFASLFARQRRDAARSGTEWESVMVQITLAFVIILGYLISKGIIETQTLTAQVEQLRDDRTRLNRLVADIRDSDIGKEREQRIEAQRQLQLQRLLKRWLMVQRERLFYRLVQQYRNAEQVQLSDNLQSLPVESSFRDLNAEIDRIFLSGTEKVSPQELQTLMENVLTAERFDLSAVQDVLDRRSMSPDETLLHDDTKTPTLENLITLKRQIADDLGEERNDLVQIQYALVKKIADARRKKLLALPLEVDADTVSDANILEFGQVILERILSELHDEMRLLPETADLIRGTTDSTTAVDQN